MMVSNIYVGNPFFIYVHGSHAVAVGNLLGNTWLDSIHIFGHKKYMKRKQMLFFIQE